MSQNNTISEPFTAFARPRDARKKRVVVIGSVVWFCLAAMHSALGQSYVLSDLGFPPSGGAGSASEAHGINGNGFVVGTWWPPGQRNQGNQYAFLYAGGTNKDLGTLKAGGYDYAIACGINNSNQVVGQGTTQGSFVYHAFLYTNGVMVDLDTTGRSWSSANAINQRGQIVGEMTASSGMIHAFLYTNGTMLDLGTLGGGYSSAKGINDSGVIVGESYGADGNTYAFVYSNNVMSSLGTLGGSYSSARAINNAGQIVGEANTASGETHAFLYSGGVMTDLGTFGGTNSTAFAINNAGQVAGYALTTNQDAHAFLFNRSTMIDLHKAFSPPPGWTNVFLTLAYGINDFGRVVGGVNYITNGVTNYDAFVLSPAVTLASPAALTNNQFKMTIQGAPGQRFAIQASTDFVNWTSLNTNTLVSDSTNWAEAGVPTNKFRFYRALTLP